MYDILEELKPVFNGSSDAVICGRDGIVAYLNPRAERLFGKGMTGCEISALVKQELPSAAEGPVVVTADINGKDASIEINAIGDVQVLTVTVPGEKENEWFKTFCERTSRQLCESLSVYSAALGILRQHIEKLENGRLSPYAAMLTHSGYSLMRCASNISRLGELDNEEKVKSDKFFDVVELCGDIVSSVSHFSGKTCAKLQFKSDVEIAVVCGTPERLEEAIFNILSNSFKYTPSDGTVTLTVEKADESVRIVVADNGCGIPIHMAGSTAYMAPPDMSDGKAGIGLGLLVARKAVGTFGGRMLVTAPDSGGTHVIIELPEASRYDKLRERGKRNSDAGAHLLLTAMADVLDKDCYRSRYLD